MAAGPDSTGADALTVSSAAQSVFDSLLSDEPEYSEDRETQSQAEGDEPEASQAESEEAPEPSEEQEQAEQTEQTEEPEQTEEEPAETTAQAEKHRLKVDGEDVEVTLDELKKGYSRTADYTRKTQALSERSKALETETQAARQERAQLAQNLKLLDEAIAEITPKEPDWAEIARNHPDKYAVLHAEWTQGQKDRADLRAQREAAERKVAEDHFNAMQETVRAERVKLYDAIPEWKDEKVEKAEKDEIRVFAAKYGITADDLKGITDHRHLLFLRDAMRFNKSQAKRPEIIKQIEKVRTTKPGAGQMSRPPANALQRSLERLAKSGRREDAQSVFLNAIDD